MSSTPAPRYVCPRCRAGFVERARYCRECGADMDHASPLEAARREPTAQVALADTSASDPRELGAPVPNADRRLSDSNQAWLGRVVDGRYRVLEVIGRGGMGVVYRVEHLRMGKIAAMKVLHRDLAGDPDVVHRFEREAAAVSRLHHPHSVQVFDFGNAQGALYLIMELIRGQDLGALVARDGAMPWSRAALLFAQICGALQEAHELGVVHRDLKPENVLVTRASGGRDYAKVLDFGLAQLDRPPGGEPLPSTTDRAQIVGTPYFMSPEQIRGDAVDERSDLYSLGALMFNVLTGEQLFTGSTAVGVLTKHLTNEPDPPSMRAPRAGLPPQVDHIVLRCLAKDPAARFQTASSLAEAIEEVFAETVGEITGTSNLRGASSKRIATTRLALIPDDSTEHGDRRLRRSDIDSFERAMRTRRAVGLTGAAVVALGLAGAVAWFLTREPPLVTEEREPNDELAHANRIATGVPITGYLGRRRSRTEGDRDLYRVRWPDGTAGQRHVVTVTATGLPNLALQLTLLSDSGATLAEAEETPVGEGAALHRRMIDGPLYVEVAERGDGVAQAIENVSDPYTLTVTVEPDGPGDATGWEAEPNNTAADATPLAPGRELRGFLDTRKDVDQLRLDGPDGAYGVVVRGDGVPLVWHGPDDKPRSPGAADLTLHHGDLIRLERRDRDAGHGPLVGRDAPWSITLTRR
jgi:serine/threonine-protein kinase